MVYHNKPGQLGQVLREGEGGRVRDGRIREEPGREGDKGWCRKRISHTDKNEDFLYKRQDNSVNPISYSFMSFNISINHKVRPLSSSALVLYLYIASL